MTAFEKKQRKIDGATVRATLAKNPASRIFWLAKLAAAKRGMTRCMNKPVFEITKGAAHGSL